MYSLASFGNEDWHWIMIGLDWNRLHALIELGLVTGMACNARRARRWRFPSHRMRKEI